MTSVIRVGLWSCHRMQGCNSQIGINPLRKMCLQDFLPFTFIETRITASQLFMGVKHHECVDEVTVNRVKPPLLLWEQAWPLTPDLTAEALYGWLSQQLCRPPDHKHSPWARWAVMDGNLWATRSAESGPCGVNHMTSCWCVYVDVHVWKRLGQITLKCQSLKEKYMTFFVISNFMVCLQENLI